MYIVKREFENQETNYLLKLNRTDHRLEGTLFDSFGF